MKKLFSCISLVSFVALISSCGNDDADKVDKQINKMMDSSNLAVGVSGDRKSTRLNSSHIQKSRMPSSA